MQAPALKYGQRILPFIDPWSFEPPKNDAELLPASLLAVHGKVDANTYHYSHITGLLMGQPSVSEV